MMKRDTTHLALLLCFSALCLTIAIVGFQTPHWYAILGDTDSYTRLTRLWHFLSTGNWFDNHFPYYNAPWGIELHWTKPLDACLLLSMSVLRPFMAAKDALYYGSFVWNPLFLYGGALALAWGAYPRLGRTGALFMGMLVLLQPTLLGNAHPNRVDHHIMAAFLECLALAICLREPLKERALGLVLAVGLWVSIEFGIFVSLLVFSLYWLKPLKATSNTLFWMALGLTIFTVIERGPDALNTVDIQRLSLVHVYLAWVGYGVLRLQTHRGPWHLLISGVMMAVALFSYLSWFDIPFQVVDPRIKTVWFDKVDEIKSAFAGGQFDLKILIVTIGAFVGMAACYRGEYATLLLPGLVIYTALTYYQRRHGYYLAPYVALALGFLGSVVLEKYQEREPHKATTLLLGLMLLPTLTTLAILPFVPDQPKQTMQPTTFPLLVQSVADQVKPGDSLFLWPDRESTALVWHLGVKTVYAPYHQNVEGILDAITFKHEPQSPEVQHMLKRRGITHVMVAQSNENGFKIPNDPPAYLRAIPLPGELSADYRFYEVR